MSAPALESSTPLPPLERHGQIEVDAFCIGCFYNLHGQVVSIDPRLGFPICRCPECGRYQPAGNGVTSASVWLRRFASILLALWIFINGLIVVGFWGIFMGFSSASVGMYAVGESIPTIANQWRFQYHLLPWNVPTSWENSGFSSMVYLSTGSLFSGFVLGTLCVTLLWHWPRMRYLWMIVVPLLPVAILQMFFHSLSEYQGIVRQCMERVLFQTGVQCIGIVLGVLLGRMLSRGIVRMVIPPRPRQFLAFLWLVDGKQPPPVR
jgi:hypothetical protein